MDKAKSGFTKMLNAEGVMMHYKNRSHAGRQLAKALADYTGRKDAVVLALPRGGVPVAFEVAQTLMLPLDVFLVRKLGVPGRKELAMGAIASGELRLLNEDIVQALHISDEDIARAAAQEQQELQRREIAYRGDRPERDYSNQTVILIDDGLATGASMRAAIIGLKAKKPARIVVAVPVAAPDTCEAIGGMVDRVVCLFTPEPLHSIGKWYDDFSQTTDIIKMENPA
jgi:predicted phosphoribosyltransferase